MKFDLKDFRKVQSTRSHTVMQHPHGHMIHLDHDQMDKQQLADLHKLPFHDHKEVKKMAKGGQVQPPKPQIPGTPEDKKKIQEGFKGALGFSDGGGVPEKPKVLGEEDAAPAFSWTDVPTQAQIHRYGPNSARGLSVPKGVPGSGGVEGAPDVEESPATASNQLPIGNTDNLSPVQEVKDPFGAEAQAEQQKKGYAEQQKGLEEEARAQSDLGKAEAEIQGKYSEDLNTLNADYERTRANKQAQADEVYKAVFESKVNPNQLYQNAGVASNILTGIGLILGGAGAPATGGRNLAADFIDKQIENNIKAQTTDLENRQKLLHYHLQDIGNLDDAMKMKRATLQIGTAALLDKAAATAKSPMAMAMLHQKAGQLKEASAANIAQATARSNILKAGESGRISPEDQITALPGTDKVKTEAREELGAMKGTEAAVAYANNIFQEASKLSSASSVAGANLPIIGQVGTDAYKKLETLKSQAVNAIRSQMKGQGALSDNEIQQSVLPNLPAVTDTPKQLAVKQKALIDFLKLKVANSGTNLNTLHVKYKPNLDLIPVTKIK